MEGVSVFVKELGAGDASWRKWPKIALVGLGNGARR